MKTLKKSFTVEMTEQEIELVTDALHDMYKSTDNGSEKQLARKLRNGFGDMIRKFYMGADA